MDDVLFHSFFLFFFFFLFSFAETNGQRKNKRSPRSRMLEDTWKKIEAYWSLCLQRDVELLFALRFSRWTQTIPLFFLVALPPYIFQSSSANRQVGKNLRVHSAASTYTLASKWNYRRVLQVVDVPLKQRILGRSVAVSPDRFRASWSARKIGRRVSHYSFGRISEKDPLW